MFYIDKNDIFPANKSENKNVHVTTPNKMFTQVYEIPKTTIK